MNNTSKDTTAQTEHNLPTDALSSQSRNPSNIDTANTAPSKMAELQFAGDKEDHHWWIKLFVGPLLLLACGAVLIAGLGIAQRLGFISAGGGKGSAASVKKVESYICPMMCTPPQTEPGRCPVCAMELVLAAPGGGNSSSSSIQVAPAARRVANIQTKPVRSMPMSRTIRAMGELSYDEGTLKTISAYVDGRIDRLYADYTGVFVEKGDHLALVYSPTLYTGQNELLLAKKALDNSRSVTRKGVFESNKNLYESARGRLLELGMTEAQIVQMESSGMANSRMHLCAPITGTVIEKVAAEGEYVKEGQVICKLADLSTVWLMLELFPDDAAIIRYGQKVEAEVQSLPGQLFSGRVAFIDPTVNSQTRTVGVRVVIDNPDGALRIGDYAKAIVKVPITKPNSDSSVVYDPELAGKWISPRHPHIVADSSGKCPICDIDLVPADNYGFANEPGNADETLVIQRSAVLMAGSNSIVYVETEPGHFEIRRVTLGPICGEDIVILEGVEKGDNVAVRGNFLIDSQMQLAGNPSLIDPTRAAPASGGFSATELAAISDLPEEDIELAMSQQICPVTKMALGSMGTPPKVKIDGKWIFLCCQGCEDALRKDPETHLANLKFAKPLTNAVEAAISLALGKLSPADRKIVEQQQICPVADYRLGSMGEPKKVNVNGTIVFICCEGCRESLLGEPSKYLAKIKAFKENGRSADDDSEDEFPDFEAPEIIEININESNAISAESDESTSKENETAEGTTDIIRIDFSDDANAESTKEADTTKEAGAVEGSTEVFQ